jgi:hypothetical protein
MKRLFLNEGKGSNRRKEGRGKCLNNNINEMKKCDCVGMAKRGVE